MKNAVMIILIFLAILVCGGLGWLTWKIASERYKLLRHVGKGPLIWREQQKNNSRQPLYKKFLRHKYSRGSAYDRAKLRTNRFQKNYQI